MASPGLPQRVGGTFAAPGEVEVMPDHDMARAETADQQPIDEFLRRHVAHAVVEAQYDDPVDAVELERLELFPQPGEPRRRGRSLEVLARRGLESHDRGRQAEPLRPTA